jgi:hypothetical protein
MKLNKLTYQTFEEKARRSILWFELLIDGETVEKLIGDEKAIPYFFFDENDVDLPTFLDYQNKKYHVIGICTCGDVGCGSTDCEIEKDENFVNLLVIFPSGYKHPKELKFTFSRENYDSVIIEIKKRAKKYKEKDGAR